MSDEGKEVGGSRQEFAAKWPYPQKEQQKIGATSYKILTTTERYRSGRQKFRAVFYGADSQEMARRDAMQMTSRAGDTYYVVQSGDVAHTRTAWIEKQKEACIQACMGPTAP